MASKSVGGFDLALGYLYNDGYFNKAPPIHKGGPPCSKCSALTTLHSLRKTVFAFGLVIEKTCKCYTCPDCLNEIAIMTKKQKQTNNGALKRFKALPLNIQQRLLKEVK